MEVMFMGFVFAVFFQTGSYDSEYFLDFNRFFFYGFVIYVRIYWGLVAAFFYYF